MEQLGCEADSTKVASNHTGSFWSWQGPSELFWDGIRGLRSFIPVWTSHWIWAALGRRCTLGEGGCLQPRQYPQIGLATEDRQLPALWVLFNPEGISGQSNTVFITAKFPLLSVRILNLTLPPIPITCGQLIFKPAPMNCCNTFSNFWH